MNDFNLWDFVKQTITPLNKPKKPMQKFYVREEDDCLYLDLHNHTLNEAYILTQNFLKQANGSNKDFHIITGRSGEIRREFPLWMETHPLIKSCKKEWHGGSFKITLK